MADDDSGLLDSLTYDASRGVYEATYDSREVAPSTAVVAVVAAVEDEATTELEPLYDVVDTVALDRLCRNDGGRYSTDRTVEFTYHGYALSVRSTDQIFLSPADGTDGL